MKFYGFKTIVISVCAGLFILLTSQQSQGQEERPLNLNDIQKVLVFRSRISVTTAELNYQLISEIRKRKVNFILTLDDEKSLKKAGGGDLLIKTIQENLPEKLREKIILYQKYVDNYAGTLKQKKIALEAAREYVKKYSDSKDDKEIIDYFNAAIPVLEQHIDTNFIPCRRN